MTQQKKRGAIVFDMDGLLLNTEQIFQKSWHYAVKKGGHSWPEETFFQFLGRSQEDSQQLLLQLFGTKEMPHDFQSAMETYYEDYLRKHGIPLKPGALELLEWCQAHGFSLAVATSTDTHKAEQRLSQAGLRSYLGPLIGGDKVQQGKPAPDIYLRAAEAMGVASHFCFAFEDSYAGVRAATAAGMKTFMIPDLLPPTQEMQDLAHHIFLSLHEVPAYFEQHESLSLIKPTTLCSSTS